MVVFTQNLFSDTESMYVCMYVCMQVCIYQFMSHALQLSTVWEQCKTAKQVML